ncbi:unnamed protein product [Euphydryas editha]|uniref:Uncharacterized protein n=1 Tax=Euphydryas editha TaxID=104508 RepID=A0AAU9UJ48_EUPED|nr:unnamed protein product [Euphydryas editha]
MEDTGYRKAGEKRQMQSKSDREAKQVERRGDSRGKRDTVHDTMCVETSATLDDVAIKSEARRGGSRLRITAITTFDNERVANYAFSSYRPVKCDVLILFHGELCITIIVNTFTPYTVGNLVVIVLILTFLMRLK